MSVTELRVLGPVEVVGDDGLVRLGGKHLRLLAALAVADGRTRGVDQLVEDIWGGDAPASARKLVQVYVSQVRKVLPPGVAISTRNGSYAVELEPGVLDAARFEVLLSDSGAAREAGNPALAASLADQALALWRGRAYGELAYEDFARAESERLEELRLVAFEERLAARLALGEHAGVLGDVLSFAEENPHRERAHELAMLALYRCGRQADALDHYAVFRARLDDELGLEPGKGLRGLQRRVLEQDPKLDVASDVHARPTLPESPNALLGREREVAELRDLLDRRKSRLVVLTGAGGSGKTRLALEAARQSAGSYANGVVLVELAPVRDPTLVVPTIAQALDVSLDTDGDELDALTAALGSHELLLLMDNAEHLREAASVYAELVARAPRLTVLVTSRAVLHVSGERVFPVAPLELEPAVELFVERARHLEPDFKLTSRDDPDVREICRRVDCLPLAIELAAARVRTLAPHVLLQRLDSSLGVLTRGPRDLPARQQTLRETIDWSVDLLDEAAQDVLARLAVFPAGATLEACERVCGADIDQLAVLVDDHLVRRDDTHDESRFGMLETIREYAVERLGDARESTEIAMAAYFADVVQGAYRELTSAHWLPRIDAEFPNLRAAIAAASRGDDAELAVRLAGGLWRYWWVRGSVDDGLGTIERALAREGPPSVPRARALSGAAGLAWSQGDFDRAEDLATRAVLVAEEVGAKWEESSAQTVLGVVANSRGDRARARMHHERSIDLAEELGVEPLVEKMNLANVALDSDDYETAATLFEDVLAARRRHEDDQGIGIALLNLGVVRFELGDVDIAAAHFEEARRLMEAIGFEGQIGNALQGLACVAGAREQFGEAVRLLARGYAYLDRAGWETGHFASTLVADLEARAREALGDEVFEAAYAEGLAAD